MSEVARDAGVALGTVYRYFPSKTWLFSIMFEFRIKCVLANRTDGNGSGRIGVVEDALVELTRELLRTPRLSSAMVRSSLTGYASVTDEHSDRVEGSVVWVVQRLLGEDHPDPRTASGIRLLVYSWWGVLVSAINKRVSAEQAESDLRRAVRLLLSPTRV